MRLHEQARDAARHGGARQHRDEFPLAARGGAPPAGQLHRVRGVEHHRAAGLAQDGERAHVRHQVAVAERETALADQDVVRAARLFCLVDHVPHLLRRQKLALFDVDRPAGRSRGADEIGLAGRETPASAARRRRRPPASPPPRCARRSAPARRPAFLFPKVSSNPRPCRDREKICPSCGWPCRRKT